MEPFNNIILNIIVIITSISTIVLVLDAVGFLPYKFTKWLTRNRIDTTIEVLRDLGFDIKENKEKLHKCLYDEKNIKRIEEKLNKCKINKKVEIGKSTSGHFFSDYIDLMGACCNERTAQDFARELHTFNKKLKLDYDFVVTSKLGTPILAYEFSKLVKKPFVLHSEEEKFRLKNENKDEVKSKFDFGILKPNKVKKALIVDDSTTGGRKVLEVIDDLRRYKYEVNDCLVVFVPIGKDVENKLKEKNVNLHKIIEIKTKIEE
jgi:orotate phosphoribosyltransferase